MDDGKDRIDLLAVDRDGNLVVAELKRDLIGGEADLQALRYAAMTSTWTYEQVQRQAEGYWMADASRGTFAQEVEKFCAEGYEVNQGQRVILAGREIKPRLGTMALWLREQGIDVRVVAIDMFHDDGRLYLQPQVVIPPPSEERYATAVSVRSSDRPWLRDGQAWHLEQRASTQGREIIEELIDIIDEAAPEATGPHWPQKIYISWKSANRVWIYLDTGATVQYLNVKGCPYPAEEVASRLGWETFDPEAELADKLGQGSNVALLRSDGAMTFRVKSVDDLAGDGRKQLVAILRDSWLRFASEAD